MTVVENEPETDRVEPVVEDTPEPQTHYADAREFALEDYDYPVPGFINELLDELDKELAPEDARLMDKIDPSKDIDDGLLVAYPDESLMFIGKDPTAKDAMPWYAFTVEPMEPTPAPQTASEALDLLKPPTVQDVVEEGGWIPDRHGEWRLLPTTKVPLSTTFQPGVKAKPYGPSPLGNHVPREYAFTEPADRLMDRFREKVGSAPSSIQTPPEVIKWSWRQQNKEPSVRPDDAPEWADIRAWAGDVLVRGTIRHRDDDHFVEDVGEQWHIAVTHRVEVYTADSVGQGVHLDYYGQ
jgi:hypothetical protein